MRVHHDADLGPDEDNALAILGLTRPHLLYGGRLCAAALSIGDAVIVDARERYVGLFDAGSASGGFR
ncbi:MAG TPA: hypothetical protein VM689_01755 [Aliidongia sp.]|nr:hypothetical protein [Aliidongia sp.]